MPNLMEESMRWFGPADPVTLAEIRQTGATGVFSALHEVPAGEEWPVDRIHERREAITSTGLRWSVVESIPVSEAIKTRIGDFRRHIANYKETLRRLGAAGIDTVVYNFMPVLDWVRTDLRHRLPDGAEALLFCPVKFAAFDLYALGRPDAERDFTPGQCKAARAWWVTLNDEARTAFVRQTLNLFPGVKMNLSIDGLRGLLVPYAGIDAALLREHLELFLTEVAPVALAAGVRLAIHPDDPPFPVLGLPRIVSTERDLLTILAMHDSPANGVCYCTGSLGARDDNDLPGMARRLGSRINAVHLRSVQRLDNGDFYEAAHLGGSTDMRAVVRVLLEEQVGRRRAGRPDWRFAFRPDHGHVLLDDFRRPASACPGYPLIGRLRGLAELRGLQHGISCMLAAG